MTQALYRAPQQIEIESSTPQPPPPGHVRVRVAYCGICGTDLHIYHGKMEQRLHPPQPIGHEMSGIIDAVAPDVHGWQPGDHVTVRPLLPCGECPACLAGHQHICYNLKFMGIDTPGAFQQWWNVPAFTLHRLPPELPLDLAALTEPVAVACHDIRLSGLEAGHHVAIIGGGPIGILIALIAAHHGAHPVVIEINPARIRLARELGITIVDPTSVDPRSYIEEVTCGAGADIVFEASASAAGAQLMTALPRSRGTVVIVGINPTPHPVDLMRCVWRELRIVGVRVYEAVDFENAIDLIAGGRLPLQQVITARYPLDRLPEAFAELSASPQMLKIMIQT